MDEHSIESVVNTSCFCGKVSLLNVSLTNELMALKAINNRTATLKAEPGCRPVSSPSAHTTAVRPSVVTVLRLHE